MKTTTEEEKIAKLPVWAQALISQYKFDAKHWKAKALAATGEEGETNTRLRDGMETHGLPPGSVIRFGDDENFLDVYLYHGDLNVMGSQGIALFPGAANVVRIKLA